MLNTQRDTQKSQIYLYALDLFESSKLQRYRAIVAIGEIVDQHMKYLDFVRYLGIIPIVVHALTDIDNAITSSFRNSAYKALLDTLDILTCSHRNTKVMIELNIIPIAITLLHQSCDFIKASSLCLIYSTLLAASTIGIRQCQEERAIFSDMVNSKNKNIANKAASILKRLPHDNSKAKACFFDNSQSLANYYKQPRKAIAHRCHL